MKSQFVLLLFITSIVTNYVDVQADDTDEKWVVIQNEDCGPSSFSQNVEDAFLREISRIDLESNLYKMRDWIIIIEDDFCHLKLEVLFELSQLVDYHQIKTINGAWKLNFQSGDIAYSMLSEWMETAKVWGFYPDTNVNNELRYEPNDPYYVSGDQWHLNNYGQNSGNSGIDINSQNAW